MQEFMDLFKIGSALYPMGTMVFILMGGLLIVLSILLSYQLRGNIVISGLVFLGVNSVTFFTLLLFSFTVLNIENYVLLKEAKGISVEEFITLEKNARLKKQIEITNQNSKSEKLKRVEEKYNL